MRRSQRQRQWQRQGQWLWATPHLTGRTAAGAAALTALLALLALAGCSSGASDNGSQSSGDSAAGSTVASAASGAEPATAADGARATFAQAKDGSAVTTTPQQAAVISTGDVELRAGNVARVLFDVHQVVDRFQGTVQKESTDTDRKGRPIRSLMTVRVPSAHFTDAMQALGRTGTLVSTSSNSRDVTTAVLDNDVRVQVERRSIDRISALLDQAASIKDVIAIEGQLSERQADLASLEQQQRYLGDQTSMSTITVSLEQTTAATPTSDDHHAGFAAGLGAGWHALRGSVVALLTALGAVLPWLVVVLVLGVPGVPLWRRLRRRTLTSTGAQS